jgi:ABC-type sulfate transport system substrate-binding protein
MSLTEEQVIDQISVDAENRVSVRQATIVRRDGEEIAKTYHRWVLSPGDDVSSFDERVQAVCAVVWAPPEE